MKPWLIILGFLPALASAETEKLTFKVKWFLFTAGQATLEVQPPETVDGIPCFHFQARAQSRILFFFKVDDLIESYATADKLLPVKFKKHLREGKYKKDLTIVFDRQNHTAKYNEQLVPLGPDCRDTLAAFYFFRTLPLPEPGGSLNLCVHDSKKNYPLLIQVLKKEEIEVPAGTFKTVQIQLKPHPDFEGIFKRKGDIWIWLTDDEKRIPVQIKAEVPILKSIKIVLTPP